MNARLIKSRQLSPLVVVLFQLLFQSFGPTRNFLFCEAFSIIARKPTVHTTTRHSSTFTGGKLSASPAANSADTMVTTPNWRTLDLPKEDEELSSVLTLHESWSDTEYNSALDLHDKLMNCADSYVSPKIKEALNCLDHAYRLYGPQSVICSYNGGKDAVVILHLVRAAHAKYYSDQMDSDNAGVTIQPIRPRVIYFENEDEFPEVLSLLHKTVSDFDLDMLAFGKGCKFSDGLNILVNNNVLPGAVGKNFPMAFVLGTRDSDPNAGNQGQFSPSSHYMPPFMRVNPVLDWSYGHVWHFLRLFELPYCVLYDVGYTSLGTTKDTLPCPALAVAGAAGQQTSGVPKYWPAYMLRDWDQERAGRVKKEKKEKKAPSSPKKKGGGGGGAAAAELENANSVKSRLSQFSTVTLPTAAAAEAAGDNSKQVVESAVASASGQTTTPPVSVSEEEMDDKFPVSETESFGSDAQRSVGLLVIGDEILKGLTTDVNTQAAALALRKNNVLLKRVVVVPDDQDEIVQEILRMQKEVDIIITSGGVGPTHDDVTIKSVAAALDCKMVLNDQMVELLRDKMNSNSTNEERKDSNLTAAQMKMATLPSNSKLRYLSENEDEWPVLQCQNMFILPGVPQFFVKKIDALAVYLSSQLERSTTYKVVLSVDEDSIVSVLNSVVERHPNVIFGSYPFVDHPEVKTVVTLEGRMVAGTKSRNSVVFLDKTIFTEASFSKEKMDEHVLYALDNLIEDLPKKAILRVDNDDGLIFS